jgi:hypothetical protein
MGWSCATAAYKTLDRMHANCRAATGSVNVFTGGLMFEVSRTEHRDGAITGETFVFLDETHVRKTGTFRINPDGSVARAPAWLKALLY